MSTHLMMMHLFKSILEISIGVGTLIAILLLIMPFLKKRYVAKWRYWIWLAVAIRLVIPFASTNKVPLVHIAVPVQSERVVEVAESPTISADELLKADKTAENKVNTDEILEITAKQESTKNIKEIDWMMLGSIIWLLGGLIFIFCRSAGYIQYKKELFRWSKVVAEGEIYENYKKAGEALQLMKLPKLRLCKKQTSPLLIGIMQPTIFIPYKDYESEALFLIFKHELVHYKRKDLQYKFVLFMAKCLHWFNPLVHIAAQMADQDLEIMCDEQVLKEKEIQTRKYYMETILQMLHEENKIMLTTQFRGEKHMLKERFSSIVDQSKKKKGLFILGVLVAVILFSSMFIAIGSKQAESNVIESNEAASAVLEIKGYSIEIRPDWKAISAEDSDTYKLLRKGQNIGGIKLINEVVEEPNAANIFNLDLSDEKMSAVVLQEEGYFKVIYSIDKEVIYEQYTFTSIPNPPPYAYAIYFDRRYVSEEEVKAVLASFTMPEHDYNSPEKIREALPIEEAQEKAVCRIAREEGEEVVNLALLDQFINKMALGKDAYVEIVQYIEQEGILTIKDWYALTFSGNMGRCYGYYPLENGKYTYDNMPVTFKEITKKGYENVVDYRLDGEMRLLQIKTPVEVVTLTAQENEVYIAYQKDLDDLHLQGLKPMSVAKLYLAACIEGNDDVRYALYEPYEEGGWGWSKEEDEKYSKEESKLTTYERTKNIRNLVNGQFILQDARHGYIAYENYDEEGNAVKMGFQMSKMSNDIWKVCFMPIQ